MLRALDNVISVDLRISYYEFPSRNFHKSVSNTSMLQI